MGIPKHYIQTLAITAIENRRPKDLETAIKNGARLDLSADGEPSGSLDGDGNVIHTLAELACDMASLTRILDYTEILEIIAKNGINLDEMFERLFHPDSLVSGMRNSYFLSLLLDHWPESFGDWKDVFSLHNPNVRMDEKKVKVLIEYGIDVNRIDDNGKTCLMVGKNTATSTTHILDAGADIGITDINGRTALWYETKNVLSAIRRTNVGELVISLPDCKSFFLLAGKDQISKDPHSKMIARLLGRRLDAGLKVIDPFVPIDGYLNDITSQTNEIRSWHYRQRLDKKMATGALDQTGPPLNTKVKL